MLGLHIATMRYECHSWHIGNASLTLVRLLATILSW